MEEIKNTLRSKGFSKILLIVGGLIVVLIIFQAGVVVGFHKAAFSNRWGDSYGEIFVGRRGGMMGTMGYGVGYYTSHGATGKIVKIELPNIIILGPDNIEKVVVTSDTTQIVSFQSKIKSTDLKVGDFVVAIGYPNTNSQIQANLIRVMPVDMMFFATTTLKQ